ncbi:hypothetical protein K432DRAFT_461629 [Lepidopterella palustris CBS 459.81]|uniref:Uncharacterized protein n=1 Tax=Lepidopterella palustris CBS 459.81 TaxID=1314670 RepID=A0A8E2EIE2_9PEZI|nr:hypothetical protein K432DRAFT_461629 [Lepidopterella palustris CBS 459.81]
MATLELCGFFASLTFQRAEVAELFEGLESVLRESFTGIMDSKKQLDRCRTQRDNDGRASTKTFEERHWSQEDKDIVKHHNEIVVSLVRNIQDLHRIKTKYIHCFVQR